jgi:hypothetical protein
MKKLFNYFFVEKEGITSKIGPLNVKPYLDKHVFRRINYIFKTTHEKIENNL